MMKSTFKTIFLLIIAALSVWIINAAVNSFFYYDKPFLQVLLFQNQEISFKLVAVSFLILGLFMARLFANQNRTENAMRESEEKYRSLVESTEDSIYVVDRNYKYVFMNKKHLSRMGFSGDEYIGSAYSEFHLPYETNWFIEKANSVFSTGESVQHEYKSLKDSKYFILTLSPVKKSDGTIIAVTVVSKDITERKRMEEKLKDLSLTDELTGIYNRRGFFTLVEHQLKLSKRQKRGIFMLYADLDHLKEINDTFGHQEGDLALIETANILKNNFRESDIIARIGGDEFVIIPVGTNGDNIEAITSRLQKAVEIHNSKSNRGYKLSISAGIVYYNPQNPCSIDELLLHGDNAMYEQKRQKQKSKLELSSKPSS
jgi:diguanylate cyclase (GGDEF)-like protein/PAS domain S-box-containing protein